jgi:hypothetical protein
MKVALVGASGNAGSRILAELSSRGHAVTAIARHPEKIAKLPNVTPVSGDADDADALAGILRGHDVVVTSIHFTGSDANKLIAAVKKSGTKRYVVVGGAGSLEVAPGVKLIDAPQFPPEAKPEAAAGGAFLDKLRGETSVDWTFLSPSALFVPGQRTGQFRLGGDQLIASEAGSSISFEDYAIALVDEIETPKHVRARFTVGY